MDTTDPRKLEYVIREFRRARRRGAIETILARLRGDSAKLLPFEEVRKKLKGSKLTPRGIQDIELDAIVGSVGRYADFTRTFLPRQASDERRWARIRLLMEDPKRDVPPIEVYKIGDAYFVADGNHRVSVARELGAARIRARVTEVETKVPLSPEDDLDDVILKAEYTNFLEETRLDELRPKADLSVTAPGRYRVLMKRIIEYQYYLEQERGENVPYEEAVIYWYDHDYTPIVRIIRERGLLRDFRGRTETDLYVWILQHREALQESLGWNVDAAAAASDLVEQYSRRPDRILKRVGRRLAHAVAPDELEAGPSPGQWRLERIATRHNTHLFSDILVAVSGTENGWNAVDQAIAVARREGSRLKGLHVLPSAELEEGDAAQAVRREFERRCEAAGVAGEFAFDEGSVAKRICDRAGWTDLVVLSLTHPPGPGPIERLGSGIHRILQRCPRPVMTVPRLVTPIDHVLLAYDGSPKSEEALFVAAYLAQTWSLSLLIMTVAEDETAAERTIARARDRMHVYDISAQYICTDGPTGEIVVETAEQYQIDIIIMGGYGANPVVEMVLGSTVEHVLRFSRVPTLICR